MLELTPAEVRPPGPTQTGIFDGPPGLVEGTSLPETKVAFFASMFAARSDVHAVRWENARHRPVGMDALSYLRAARAVGTRAQHRGPAAPGCGDRPVRR